MQGDRKIRVCVMHKEPLARAGIEDILSRAAGIELFCGGGVSLDRPDVDVIVTDYDGGLRLGALFSQRRSGARCAILIVTRNDREYAVRRALEEGVHGYILQCCRGDELVAAVRSLHGGEPYLGPSVARCLADSMGRMVLTARETDVLTLMGKGFYNKSIACELGIGAGTVKSHIKAVMKKLNANARTHAVVLAMQRGLIGQ